MNVFFDTSSLFKLYHNENGTEQLIQLFTDKKIEVIYLADITRIEFSSVVWRKCRMKEISETLAILLIEKFDHDSPKFVFVPDTKILRSRAIELIANYWKKGLRSLDSIQLSSALKVKSKTDLFISSDLLLLEIAEMEGLNTKF